MLFKKTLDKQLEKRSKEVIFCKKCVDKKYKNPKGLSEWEINYNKQNIEVTRKEDYKMVSIEKEKGLRTSL